LTNKSRTFHINLPGKQNIISKKQRFGKYPIEKIIFFVIIEIQFSKSVDKASPTFELLRFDGLTNKP